MHHQEKLWCTEIFQENSWWTEISFVRWEENFLVCLGGFVEVIVHDFYTLVVGHTALKVLDPIRTPKWSSARPGEYWGGRPPGKALRCWQQLRYCTHHFILSRAAMRMPRQSFSTEHEERASGKNWLSRSDARIHMLTVSFRCRPACSTVF